MRKNTAQYQTGDHVTGAYYGVPFSGVIHRIRWHTVNYLNVCVSINLDRPIETPSRSLETGIYMEIRPNGRDVTGQSRLQDDTESDYWAECDQNTYPADTQEQMAPNIAVIKFHMHGGYYNDGNSAYWSTDTTVDIAAGIVTHERLDEYGGQMAGNSQFAHTEVYSLSSWLIRWLSPAEQTAIVETLAPILDTHDRYPDRQNFKWFSAKHERFFTGRIAKAHKLAANSDLVGLDCAETVFILPSYNMALRIGTNEYGFTLHIAQLDTFED